VYFCPINLYAALKNMEWLFFVRNIFQNIFYLNFEQLTQRLKYFKYIKGFCLEQQILSIFP